MQGLPLKTDIIALNFKVYRLYLRVFAVLALLSLINIYHTSNVDQQHSEDFSSKNSLEEMRLTVKRGDTLHSILSEFSIADTEINQIIDVTSSAYNLKKIQIGQIIHVHYALENDQRLLQSISMQINNDRKLNIYRDDTDIFRVKEIFIPLTKNVVKLSATIDSSIFDAAKKAGIPTKSYLKQ